MTNREWLLKEMQNMSDEELTEAIKPPDCLCDEQRSKNKCEDSFCPECKMEWLNQEHKEKIRLSEAERVILENISKEFGWVARDESGRLYIYASKPVKGGVCWYLSRFSYSIAFNEFNHLFRFIKWEDEEPYNIEELIESSED